MSSGTTGLRIHLSWFEAAALHGVPALGTPETLEWSDITSIVANNRRVGDKDGPNFIPARFTLEPDGRHVRRLGRNVVARTLIALDCEPNKKTGELPPAPGDLLGRLQRLGVAAIVYTSHNHLPDVNPRYRVVAPISQEIAPALPAPEVLARELDLLGVLDFSKRNPASLSYLPSAACFDHLEHHEAHVTTGQPIDATVMRAQAAALLAERQAEQDRIAAEAHAQAAERLAARLSFGDDPNDSLIQKLRQRFDLRSVLIAHKYDLQRGTKKYRHPNSSPGSFGADVRKFSGIERVYSHNATDPLHRDNLLDWCGGVTALDVVDVVVIFEFAGDRTRALRELAQRFGLNKAEERRAVAALLFRMIQNQASQERIEAAAFGEGQRLGLTRTEVIEIAQWVASEAVKRPTA